MYHNVEVRYILSSKSKQHRWRFLNLTWTRIRVILLGHASTLVYLLFISFLHPVKCCNEKEKKNDSKDVLNCFARKKT